MPTTETAPRGEIAAAIRAARTAVAEEVTEQFLAAYPEWLERYGDRARRFGVEDAGYHLDFLAAAVESGQLQSFVEYGEWAARMLLARGIAVKFLVENLEHIAVAMGRRLPESSARVVQAYLRECVGGILAGRASGSPPPPSPLDAVARMYTEAAISGMRQAALNLVLEAVRQGHSVIDIHCDVLQNAMYRIGRLWESNQISVAKEHMATAITQYVIAQLYPLIEPYAGVRGRIVITGVEGELHQVGANMVADVLEASGWDVRFLGANTPTNTVLDAVEEHRADVLGISATMLFNVPQVMRLTDSVRRRRGERIRVVVGGAAFRSAPELYAEVGAQGFGADLRSAIELVNGFAVG